MTSSNQLLIEEIGPFHILPVVHHSYEFTLAAAQAFHQLQPTAVAVEYPSQFQDHIDRAIHRLPKISVLVFGQPVRSYIRIEPLAPFVEVIRLAYEKQIPAKCIDAVVPDYPQVFEPLPDTYAISKIGHEKSCREILNHLVSSATEADEMRESAMAFHLQQLLASKEGPFLVLCGISHLRGLKDRLECVQPQPFESLTKAKLYHLSSSSLGEVMGCFPFLTSVYELQREGNIATTADQALAPILDTGKLQVVEGRKKEDLEAFAKRSHAEVSV